MHESFAGKEGKARLGQPCGPFISAARHHGALTGVWVDPPYGDEYVRPNRELDRSSFRCR